MKTHLDLFSGIGGFALAARWAGFETVQFVELENYAQRVLTKNFPGVPIHDNIKTFDATKFRGLWLMTVTSGLRCLESYVKPDPLMSCVKMLLATSRWASTQCYLIWKEKVTPANRLLFQLSPKMQSIDETESGLLATPEMWPTPTQDSVSERTKKYAQGGTPLTMAVKMWPTPRASDGLRENMSMVTHMKVAQREDGGFQTLHSEIAKAEEVLDLSGSLNPQWVEWLMGYPIGWTDLKD